jgi:hypothetical protein
MLSGFFCVPQSGRCDPSSDDIGAVVMSWKSFIKSGSFSAACSVAASFWAEGVPLGATGRARPKTQNAAMRLHRRWAPRVHIMSPLRVEEDNVRAPHEASISRFSSLGTPIATLSTSRPQKSDIQARATSLRCVRETPNASQARLSLRDRLVAHWGC